MPIDDKEHLRITTSIHTMQDRIISLDILRGVAVLGIFWMNIQSFSAPFAAYANPTAYGDFSGVNLWLWALGHIFVEFKFMTIFSMLFGVGIAVFYQRATAKGLDAVTLNNRRMRWLVIFGLMHAYLIWYGDILFTYALCGFIAVKFVNTGLKKLLTISGALFLVPIVFTFMIHLTASYDDPGSLTEAMSYWSPSDAELQSEIAAFKGSWLESRIENSSKALLFQLVGIFFVSWRALSLMLIGIVMFKTGFITASLKPATYRLISSAGIGLGVFITTIGMVQNLKHGFSLQYSSDIGGLFNYVGSLVSAVGYIALIMLFVKSQYFTGLKSLLTNVGKMAFTNYIMQSVLASLIFYGFGLNYFAEVSRAESLIVVPLVWLLQLVLSTFWLSRYRQGPLEGVWRRLTYR
jgi:uncharacterized protein